MTFDDTYWGIETKHCTTCEQNVLAFWWYLLRNWNRVEVQCHRARTTFDDTYWGIETQKHRRAIPRHSFWWYLLRNWNIARIICRVGVVSFWWYLLRNWNPEGGNVLPESLRTFDDTYWGIETRKRSTTEVSMDNLLMIPIEELKLLNTERRWTHGNPFDDTYWGIETLQQCSRSIGRHAFDDTYWGIETIYMSIIV